ncbi:CE1759 family FMN reductase [Schaalia vaccimaxillae]|uniref:CE1759 family FMN reductase n=1 Tax=Schaalia vaccimaxillae TaxID=183916 RepID=UPI0003F972A1|nr:CE1759 family FMN reductase [Schaalia vaccimaxillae]
MKSSEDISDVTETATTSSKANATLREPDASVIIIHAGMSGQSSTARLADAFHEALLEESRGRGIGLDVTQIGIRGLSHAVVDQVLTGFATPPLALAQEAVAKADGLVALTPTYQASYSGMFKAFFDVLGSEAVRAKPVILGATGGTPRHSLVTDVAMRPLLTYMHADPVPTAVYAATEDWGAHASDSDGAGGVALRPRIMRACNELLDRLFACQFSLQDHLSSAQVREGEGRSEATEVSPDPSDSRRSVHPLSSDSEAAKWPGFADFETLLGGIQ